MRTILALCLVLAGCAHGAHSHHSGGKHACGGSRDQDDDQQRGFASMMNPVQGWTTVRIDEPDGARFLLERGAFSEGLDVLAPFQGTFQSTSMSAAGGFPFVIELDAATAARYGSATAVRLKGQLTVPESKQRRGVLRIAPSDCSMRALLAGDLDVLRVSAEELPTAEAVCAGAAGHVCGAEAAAPGAPMAHHCPMGHGGKGGGGCDHGGHGGRGGCGAHQRQGGCGAHQGQGGCGHDGGVAVLTLRVSKKH